MYLLFIVCKVNGFHLKTAIPAFYESGFSLNL